MQRLLPMRHSLRSRLVVGLALMLLPPLLLGAGTFLYFRIYTASLGRALPERGGAPVPPAELVARLAEVERLKHRIFIFNTAIFVLGTGMVLVIGASLAQSILRPLEQLRAGAERFAAGDLGHRLPPAGEDELGRLSAAFNAMARQLDRERGDLRELSARDPLTGLYNHREFYSLLQMELERSRRYRHPLALLMLDLDFFKQVNDTYGHMAGDEVLCAVAALMRHELRLVDHVARYGGEEFAAILPETAADEALAIARRIRQSVAARPLAVTGTGGVALTVSIGVALFPDDADSDAALVRQADQALYRAKAEGRNRVCDVRT